MIKIIFSTLPAFVFFVLVHWLHFHFLKPHDRVDSILAVFAIGFLLFGVIYKFLPAEDVLVKKLNLRGSRMLNWLPILVGGLLYFMLFIGYLVFYFTADRSITFRMMRITEERPSQSVTAQEMLGLYDTQSIILRRMDDLVYGGYYVKTGDQYSLTPKGTVTLNIYRFTIDFLHMPKF